ncbi:PrsW family intramembrane metalloprotease OS=Streptomyces tendae OX=1932 GN=GUR47_22200 PE=4 SV=1 [Streptomyces tendae]
MARYEVYATSLAFLRQRGRRGRAGADFTVRERHLLDALWHLRDVARPALEYAARAAAPPAPLPRPVPPWAYPYGGTPGAYAPAPAPAPSGPYGSPAPHPPYAPYAPYTSYAPYAPPDPHRPWSRDPRPPLRRRPG